MTSPEFTDPQAIARNAADAIRSRLSLTSVDMGLVLGSGWSAGVDRLGKTLGRIPLSELPGFFAPVVAGHGGDLVAVALPSGKTAVVLTGRTHFYEGRGVESVVHGVRTVAALGATTMILTNGCGGLDPSWGPGTIVAIRDHINLTGATPLRGATFIDMSTAWTPHLLEVTERVAPGTPTGVYAQFRGPQYETPAEVRMARTSAPTLWECQPPLRPLPPAKPVSTYSGCPWSPTMQPGSLMPHLTMPKLSLLASRPPLD